MYIVRLKKRRKSIRGLHRIYRIWYGDEVAFIGKTGKNVGDCLRRHFFAHSKQYPYVDVLRVTKVETQQHKTLSDCAVYVSYYLNLYKPKCNVGRWEKDQLSIHLPKVKWKQFNAIRMNQWKEEKQLIVDGKKQELKRKRSEWRAQAIKERMVITYKDD